MSCSVKTTWGGGVDLSSLTSAELMFIGWLHSEITWLANTQQSIIYFIGRSNQAFIPASYTALDLSVITSFTLQQTVGWGNWSVYVKSPTLGGLGHGTLTADGVDVTITPYNREGLDNCWIEMHTSTTTSHGSASVLCTAFTTTDGKVHTKANLNY